MNWSQLRTILWLRWCLTRNIWARSGGLGAVVGALLAVGSIVLGTAGFVGGFVGGLLGLAEQPPVLIMGFWFGLTVAFLLFWTIGLLAELQRSETIDLQRLMHLPVALGQIFILNYIASHFVLSIVITVPAMMGLALGLGFGRSPIMLLLVPLALSTVVMVTAWTYCLRGWLAAMMSNPRRRRTIIMSITVGFILLAQGPNLYFNLIRRTPSNNQPSPAEGQASDRQMFSRLSSAQKFVPPFWLSAGARALAESSPWPAVLGTLGCLSIGALGLRRAYRSTVRFYRGDKTSKAARPGPSTIPEAGRKVKTGVPWFELRLPGVPEQAAALAVATLRSMLRAPEVKMAWATAFIVTVIMGAAVAGRSAPDLPEMAKPFLATGSVAFALFMLVQVVSNQFGFDRDGFRALVLCPADRGLILLGKNLATLPVGLIFGVLLLGLVSFWLHLPLVSLVAGLFQLIVMLVLTGLAGNLLSILTPYRISAGSMKPTKMPAAAMITMVIFQMLFPIAMIPAFVPPLSELLWHLGGLSHSVPVNLLLSIALAALAVIIYSRTLAPLGRLLHRREQKILNIVSAEIE